MSNVPPANHGIDNQLLQTILHIHQTDTFTR